MSKFIIPYLYEAQHVSGDTLPITRSLWFYIRGRLLDAVSIQQPHIQHPSTYAKPEAARAVLGS